MEQSFDRPIPGMGMTHEVGARPWQNPPTYATVEDATDYYVERMGSREFKSQLVDVMEMGIPLTTIANTMQLSSVMEGMLLLPILVELLKSIGDSVNVKYVTGMEEDEMSEGPTSSSRILNDMIRQRDEPVEEEVMQPQELPAEQEQTDNEPMGLMARRT